MIIFYSFLLYMFLCFMMFLSTLWCIKCPNLCDCVKVKWKTLSHVWLFAIPWTVYSLSQNIEWVAFPFSRGCSQPRDRTQVSGIAGRFFTSWATREYIYILFYILFHYGLLQDIEYGSLCYIVGLCCLSILYVIVCIW